MRGDGGAAGGQPVLGGVDRARPGPRAHGARSAPSRVRRAASRRRRRRCASCVPRAAMRSRRAAVSRSGAALGVVGAASSGATPPGSGRGVGGGNAGRGLVRGVGARGSAPGRRGADGTTRGAVDRGGGPGAAVVVAGARRRQGSHRDGVCRVGLRPMRRVGVISSATGLVGGRVLDESEHAVGQEPRRADGAPAPGGLTDLDDAAAVRDVDARPARVAVDVVRACRPAAGVDDDLDPVALHDIVVRC